MAKRYVPVQFGTHFAQVRLEAIMNKIVLVAWREFKQRVRSRGFLIQTLLLPLILGGVGLFQSFSGADSQINEAGNQPEPQQFIGIVDQADLLHQVPESSANIQWRRFSDQTAAADALSQNRIDAYYLIPPTYYTTGEVQLVSKTLSLAGPNTDAIEELLLSSLLMAADEAIRTQLRTPFNGTQLSVIHVGTVAQSPEVEPIGPDDELNWLPFIVTILIMVPLFSGGSYLFQSLVQEKSNRVMEILLLAVRPYELLSGKLIGLGALTLVQYLIWAVFGAVAMLINGNELTADLAAINLTGSEVAVVVVYALGGYILYAALMAGIGAMTPDIESNRIWIFILTLPMLIPLYLWSAIVDAPQAPLAVALSLFPFSAPVTMIMRLATTTVPFWQTGTSIVLLILAGTGLIWLMARLFHTQILLSGEALSLRRIVALIRPNAN